LQPVWQSLLHPDKTMVDNLDMKTEFPFLRFDVKDLLLPVKIAAASP
jgi:hypothetical protein